MEYLTKQQIILLALLVSFVSSIATGIVTVSLLEQSPPAVTQTINRVVERTIEKVSPSATTTTETIIVKEDQATIDAITKASKSIVRIESNGEFAALGVIISSGGKIAATSRAPFSGTLTARLEGGNIVSLTLTSRNDETGVTVLQAEQSMDPVRARTYSAASLTSVSNIKLGQSIIAIGGAQTPMVATGIISSIRSGKVMTSLENGSFDSQAILVNLLGEVIGMKDPFSENAFISSYNIK